jgi:hypothetical protein
MVAIAILTVAIPVFATVGVVNSNLLPARLARDIALVVARLANDLPLRVGARIVSGD